MKLNIKAFKGLFTSLLAIMLVLGTFASAPLAAGGGGGGKGGGNGSGTGGGTVEEQKEPITFEGAFLTTITDGISTTGAVLNEKTEVEAKPTVKLVFTKNVVNNFDDNKTKVALMNAEGTEVAIDVTALTDDSEKRHLFVSPTEDLTVDETYTLTVKSGIKANNGTLLEKDQVITFTVKDISNNEEANSVVKYVEELISNYIHSPLELNENATRAEFAVLLVNIIGLEGSEYDGRFNDVKGTEWFNNNNALMAAVENGIIQGNDKGQLLADDSITRVEAAALLARALKLDSVGFDTSKLDTTKKVSDFTDSKSIREWAKEDVKMIYQAGFMKGNSKGEFDPTGLTKRDQVVKILAEFLVTTNLMND